MKYKNYLCKLKIENMFEKFPFHAFLIDRNKLRDKKYFLFIGIIFILMIFISFKVGFKVNLEGDFTAFWFAGKNFFLHNDLYSQIGGAKRYIYPPFAAMLFQLLALFPLNVAASILTFINLSLFLFSIYLTRSIFEFYITDKKLLRNSLIFASILSFRFFWYHISFVQMNETIFVLCLMGVLFMLRNKETPAVICFVIATFIKVIPMFFLIWLLFRGNYKTYLKVIIVTALCILIPLIWRGFEMGIQDIKNYYITFLEPFQQGRVEAEFHNHSLSSGIYKLSLPMQNEPGFDFNILHLTEYQAKKVYFYSLITIFILFISCLSYLRFSKKPITFLEISIILLTTHLLSGITWEYHLVSLLFVYMSLFIIAKEKKSLISKSIIYFLYGIVIINAIVGKDTVGSNLYHYFGGYGSLTWMMLILLLYFLYECMFRNKYSPDKLNNHI